MVIKRLMLLVLGLGLVVVGPAAAAGVGQPVAEQADSPDARLGRQVDVPVERLELRVAVAGLVPAETHAG